MIVGAALDNLDLPAPSSFAKLARMRAGVVGTLWTDGTRHRRSVYDDLEALLDAPWYHLRVGPSHKLAPTAWADEARRALDEVPPQAHGRIRVRMLNEVNLPAEGGWAPEEYAEWLLEAAYLFDPDARVPKLTAPLSLGTPDWPDYWARMTGRWRELTGRAVPTEGAAVNAYAHLIPSAEPIRALAAAEGRTVHITETNTLALPPGPARAAWLREQIAYLEGAGYATCELFIVGGRSYGAWDERYILTEEECSATAGAGGAPRRVQGGTLPGSGVSPVSELPPLPEGE